MARFAADCIDDVRRTRGDAERSARQIAGPGGLDKHPDGTMDPDERARLVEERRKAHYHALQAKSAGSPRRSVGRLTARQAAKTAQPPAETAPVPVAGGRRARAEPDPADWADLWEQPDLRAALSDRDLGAAYRALTEIGVSQRQISVLTGQSQSEVSETLKGQRRVRDVEVLERICDGLGITRSAMRVAGDAYSDEVTVADAEGVEEMLRRHFQHLLALSAAATFGGHVKGVGELVDWLAAPPVPGTARIGMANVGLIRQCGEQIGALARTCGGQGQAAVRLAGWADQWLDAACADEVRRALLSTLSHIHTVTAWCCHDSGAVARSHYEFGRAVELATEGGDAYAAAYAMRHAGMMLADRAEPDRALKMLQLGGLNLGAVAAGDPRVAVQRAECQVISALALAQLHQQSPDGSTLRRALDALSAARDGWAPPTAHARGCMDLDSAHAYALIGKLDVAEALAATSAQIFGQSGDQREGVLADMALARLHVQAAEPRGLALARSAIDAVAQTDSAVARQCWLPPLVEALEARPGADAKELARMGRQVAA